MNGLSIAKIWTLGKNTFLAILKLCENHIDYVGSLRSKKCNLEGIENLDILTVPHRTSIALILTHTKNLFLHFL